MSFDVLKYLDYFLRYFLFMHLLPVFSVEGGSENDFEDLMQEMMLMSKLPKHENVLELTGIVNQGMRVCIVNQGTRGVL